MLVLREARRTALCLSDFHLQPRDLCLCLRLHTHQLALELSDTCCRDRAVVLTVNHGCNRSAHGLFCRIAPPLGLELMHSRRVPLLLGLELLRARGVALLFDLELLRPRGVALLFGLDLPNRDSAPSGQCTWTPPCCEV